jgi:hypothetical protein
MLFIANSSRGFVAKNQYKLESDGAKLSFTVTRLSDTFYRYLILQPILIFHVCFFEWRFEGYLSYHLAE